MNLTDLIIIYLACGAPISVYHFVYNKHRFSSAKLYLRTIFIFLFWIPFFIKLIVEKSPFIKSFFSKPTNTVDFENKIFSKSKKIEIILKSSSLDVSIYEFREIVERYIGLTLANKNQNNELSINDEFFKISDHKNIDLAKTCLKRRNRKHLSFHQIKARQDFLKLIDDLSESINNRLQVYEEAFDFVKLLEDSEAIITLDEIFSNLQQTQEGLNVKSAEGKQWIADTQKPLHENRIPIRLKAMQATATNLFKKD